MPKGHVAILFSGLLLLSAGCGRTKMGVGDSEGSASPSVLVVETEEGFAFFEGEEKVLFYQRKPKSLDGKYSRCHYIHPLYSLDGQILTEDFPKDHLHHRGIFWAWHQVLVGDKEVGDGWSLKDTVWDVYDARILTLDDGSSFLKVKVFWKSPLWTDSEGWQKPFVKETAVIRVYPACEEFREIDFEISLLALEDEVRIGGANNKRGYGGFSTRIRLPKDISFTGQGGDVVPIRTAVEAGPWLDFSGDFQEDGEVSGLAILCHRSLPGYPQRWILRRAGSMQNAVYPGQEPVTLSREEPLVLRYRLIVHRGDARHVDLDKLQAEYNTENKPSGW
ncbi:MAG: DUF6807 family protein [Planctomycetota bacterium]|jgi:hypothetical protein